MLHKTVDTKDGATREISKTVEGSKMKRNCLRYFK